MVLKMQEDSGYGSQLMGLKPDFDLVQAFAKSMLQGRLFIGEFQEKRYVVKVNSYRDVVMVARDEKELIHDLEVVRNRILSSQKGNWVGITTPDIIGAPAGYCLWVELKEEVFGSYWYKIQNVKFRDQEVLLRLKVIRSVNPVKSALEEKVLTETKPLDTVDGVESSSEPQMYARVQVFLKLVLFYLLQQLSHVSSTLTFNNVRESVVFIILLLCTMFTCTIHGIKYLADYLLKLMHEMSYLIHCCTPIMITLIEVCSKIVGGFYMLIAMMWRDAVGGPPPRPPVNYNQPKRLKYR